MAVVHMVAATEVVATAIHPAQLAHLPGGKLLSLIATVDEASTC